MSRTAGKLYIKSREENVHLLVIYSWKQWIFDVHTIIIVWLRPDSLLLPFCQNWLIIVPSCCVTRYVFYVSGYKIWYLKILCSLLWFPSLNFIALYILMSTFFQPLIPLLPLIDSLILIHGFTYCTMKILDTCHSLAYYLCNTTPGY